MTCIDLVRIFIIQSYGVYLIMRQVCKVKNSWLVLLGIYLQCFLCIFIIIFVII